MDLNYDILAYRSKKELITLLHASCGYMRALRATGLTQTSGSALYWSGAVFNMEVQRALRERFGYQETIWWAIDPPPAPKMAPEKP